MSHTRIKVKGPELRAGRYWKHRIYEDHIGGNLESWGLSLGTVYGNVYIYEKKIHASVSIPIDGGYTNVWAKEYPRKKKLGPIFKECLTRLLEEVDKIRGPLKEELDELGKRISET